MKSIHHVVDVPAPIQAVWEATTTRSGLAGWWTTKVDTADVEVGTVIHFTFRPGFNPEMEVTTLERPQRLAWTCIGGHQAWQGNTFEFSFEQGHENVRFRFWQHYSVELSDDAYGIYNYNWGFYLQSLYDLVTTGSGRPFRGVTFDR